MQNAEIWGKFGRAEFELMRCDEPPPYDQDSEGLCKIIMCKVLDEMGYYNRHSEKLT